MQGCLKEALSMNKTTRVRWPRAAAALTAIAVLTSDSPPPVVARAVRRGPSRQRHSGPITPVEQVGGEPSSRPYAAVIEVVTLDGDVVETVKSGSDGAFSVRLPAGSYRLVPRSPKTRHSVRRTLGRDRGRRQDHDGRDRLRQRHPLTASSAARLSRRAQSRCGLESSEARSHQAVVGDHVAVEVPEGS